MQAIDRDSVPVWADAEDNPADERGAWRPQIWIAVVLGLLLPGLPLASLVLFDWNQRPVIASAPTFPSGAIDPSPAPLPDSAAAPEDPASPTLSGRTTAARSAETASTRDATGASGPEWLTGFVNDVRQSISSSSWADRRSQPPVMPEPGRHR
jgi:uncharacterized iron-regulated membrane protein